MNKGLKILLILVAVACFGVALYYPLNYQREIQNSESTLEQLVALRDAGRAGVEQADESPEDAPGATPPEFSEESEDASGSVNANSEESTDASLMQKFAQKAGNVAAPESEPDQEGEEPRGEENPQSEEVAPMIPPRTEDGEAEGDEPADPASMSAPVDGAVVLPNGTRAPDGEAAEDEEVPEATPVPSPSPTPEPTINRWERTGPLAYPDKDKVTLDVDKILPEYQEIYKMNNDLVGWLTIPGIDLDAPVVQCEDSEYYLHHDFFGEKNANGQIILDTNCDPYTPSYNLVISGHNMRSGKMFGNMANYSSKSFWEKHKLLEFDTLMERKLFVVIAAFYSANYDVDEEGFRYNADIEYSIDLKSWMREIKDNQLYDTEIDTQFGDEFLTLTTCNYSKRKDGRFVVICRKVRDGEEFE